MTIEAGKQRSDVIRVRIEDDIIVEDVEMFKLRFELNQQLMDCRVELAEPSVVDITIEDDDREFKGEEWLDREVLLLLDDCSVMTPV